jgi:hypothetical protein
MHQTQTSNDASSRLSQTTQFKIQIKINYKFNDIYIYKFVAHKSAKDMLVFQHFTRRCNKNANDFGAAKPCSFASELYNMYERLPNIQTPHSLAIELLPTKRTMQISAQCWRL